MGMGDPRMGFTTGTFTFLFTDIEGSTRKWEADPEGMRIAVGQHDTLLRDIFSRHEGRVFKTIGDAFCVAFTIAPSALAAAVEVQQALQDFDWGPVGALKVRIALNSGAAEVRDDDYFGRALNRVARILAVGHGGQVLISTAVEELVRDCLPQGVSLRDLGEHRLKDLDRPERIHQATAPGVASEFPQLRSMEGVATNLPVQLTSFIGREREMREVKRIIAENRLVTLTGAGGTGKTRLAVEVGGGLMELHQDGVWMVELALVTDPELTTESVAVVLGVREEAGRPLVASLAQFLRNKKLLLILDNCEHLLESCARLSAELLRTAPGVRIMATSRSPLALPGEAIFAVPSFGIPDAWYRRNKDRVKVEDAAAFEAVQLFCERATAAHPAFVLTKANAPLVVEVCWRLDGIPLAIELAAARTKVLSVEQISKRIDDRFRLLTGGSRTSLPHQQTLKALIDWSFDLLSETERKLLARLSVFARGRTLEAVEAVCAGEGVEEWEVLDLLSQLVDKSLVTVESDAHGDARYFLTESVWDYAREQLEKTGEYAVFERRHVEYFARWAESVKPKLFGPEQAEWLEQMEHEVINFRFALEAAERSSESVLTGLRLVAALERFWEVRGYMKEGREQAMSLLIRPESREVPLIRARALEAAGRLAWAQDDTQAAAKVYSEAAAIFKTEGSSAEYGLTLAVQGFVARAEGPPGSARQFFESALEIGDKEGNGRIVATAKAGLGSVCADEGLIDDARRLKEESLAWFREARDLWIVSLASWSTGLVLLQLQEWSAARELFRESTITSRTLGNTWTIPYVLEGLARVALGEDDVELAARLFGASDRLMERHGFTRTPQEARIYEESLEAACKALGAETRAALHKEGTEMTEEEAVQLAFGGE